MHARAPRAVSFAPLAALALLGIAGCGAAPQNAIKGTIVFDDGRPVTDGEVILHLDEERVFSAEIQDNGSFELEAPPGRYQVVVRGADDGDPGTPTVHYKYADTESSPLRIEVAASDRPIEIRVQRGPSQRPVSDDAPGADDDN